MASRQTGSDSAAVVSNDRPTPLRRVSAWCGLVTVVRVTGNTDKVYRFEVLLLASNGVLAFDSKAQAEQVRSVAMQHFLRRLGKVSPADLTARDDDHGRRPSLRRRRQTCDGMENASCEWRRPDIKALVEQQTNDHGWEFLYMGTDQDAVEVGKGLGVKDGQAITYAGGKSREALLTASDEDSR